MLDLQKTHSLSLERQSFRSAVCKSKRYFKFILANVFDGRRDASTSLDSGRLNSINANHC